jgi:hypothetical protein
MSGANQAKAVEFAIPQWATIMRADVIDAMDHPIGISDNHHKPTIQFQGDFPLRW